MKINAKFPYTCGVFSGAYNEKNLSVARVIDNKETTEQEYQHFGRVEKKQERAKELRHPAEQEICMLASGLN